MGRLTYIPHGEQIIAVHADAPHACDTGHDSERRGWLAQYGAQHNAREQVTHRIPLRATRCHPPGTAPSQALR